MKASGLCRFLLTAVLCGLCHSADVLAQQAQKSVCDEERAVLLAEKQVEEVSMLDQPQKQIAVMVRAADVLWNAQPASARKIFSDAFDLAEKLFKEKGDESRQEGRSLTLLPDQRFVVMRAIAKRDGAKLDKIRAFEVMAEAVKTINHIANPDFSSPYIQQKIEGKQFSSYYGYGVEGFSLEIVFRLLAPMDFEGALYRARSLDDKAQRAVAVLSLAAACLEELERVKKLDAEKKKKNKAAANKAEDAGGKKPQTQKPEKP